MREKLEKYRQWAMLLAILGMGTYAFYERLYRVRSAAIIAMDGDLTSLRSQAAQMEILARGGAASEEVVAQARKQLEELRAQVEMSRQKLPKEMRLSQLMEVMTRDDVRGPVNFVEFRPSQPRELSDSVEIPFQLNVLCTYKEFGQFIERVETLPIVLEIQGLQMVASKPGEPDLSISMTAKGKMLK
ncbi:MAG: type 4a pilus biogenesis protein PilO [Nitrospirae bacterium]|nr:type 4a pilus biogenesis protein PilO [Nitrospirota bacterium]